MNLRRSFLFLSIVFLLLPVLARAASLPGDIHLRLIVGDVQMQADEAPDWVPAAANTPLFEKDRLWVPRDGKADVRLINGTSLRVGPESVFEVGTQPADYFEFYLDQGFLFGNSTVTHSSGLVIYTPAATFRVDAGTVFNISATENGALDVSVLKGALYAAVSFGELKVEEGGRLIHKEDGTRPVLTGLPPEDGWIQWNRQRDDEAYGVPKSGSMGHLPPELAVYGSDLDGNGRWAYTSEYGYVWTPTVIVTTDWSPYRVGRWVWIGGDYVWISHEPWGWVPYHYGRWAHHRQIGWCWVPPARGAVHWAPAYVAWTNTPTHVSWVPLAPKETYYGKGHFGPHSVDIRQKKAIAGTPPASKNINVGGAVTTVSINTFLSGQPSQSKVNDNLFLKQRASFGAPAIAPVRTSKMPAIKDIPRGKEPPDRFRQARSPRGKEGGGDTKNNRAPKPAPVFPGRVPTQQNPPAAERNNQPRNIPPVTIGPRQEKDKPFPSAVQDRQPTPPATPRPVRIPEQQLPKKVTSPVVPVERPAQAPPASREEIKKPAVQPKDQGASGIQTGKTPEPQKPRGNVPAKPVEPPVQQNPPAAERNNQPRDIPPVTIGPRQEKDKPFPSAVQDRQPTPPATPRPVPAPSTIDIPKPAQKSDAPASTPTIRSGATERPVRIPEQEPPKRVTSPTEPLVQQNPPAAERNNQPRGIPQVTISPRQEKDRTGNSQPSPSVVQDRQLAPPATPRPVPAPSGRTDTIDIPKPAQKSNAPASTPTIRSGATERPVRIPEQEPPKKVTSPAVPVERPSLAPPASRNEIKKPAVQPKDQGASGIQTGKSPEPQKPRDNVPAKPVEPTVQGKRVITNSPPAPVAKEAQQGSGK